MKPRSTLQGLDLWSLYYKSILSIVEDLEEDSDDDDEEDEEEGKKEKSSLSPRKPPKGREKRAKALGPRGRCREHPGTHPLVGRKSPLRGGRDRKAPSTGAESPPQPPRAPSLFNAGP